MSASIAVLDSRIEIVDAGVDRASYRPFLVRRATAHHQTAHGAAAKAEDRDLEAGAAEVAHLHARLPRAGLALSSGSVRRSECGSTLTGKPRGKVYIVVRRRPQLAARGWSGRAAAHQLLGLLKVREGALHRQLDFGECDGADQAERDCV